MTIGQVAELWRYPVKSLGGELLEQANIGPRGVLGDRLWAIRDLERDITASARRIPALLTATARYLGPVPSEAGPGNVPEVEITFPDGTVMSSSDDDVHAKLSELAGREVRLTALPPADDTSLHRLRRDHQTDALSSASLRADFGVTEGEKLPDFSMIPMADILTLGRYSTPPGMFVDLAPVHVLTKTSLATIGSEVGDELDVRRFRPNVLVALDNTDEDLPESRWVGVQAHARRRRSQRHDADRALRRAQPRATRTRSRSPNYSGRGRPGGAVPRCLLRCRARRHCRSG